MPSTYPYHVAHFGNGIWERYRSKPCGTPIDAGRLLDQSKRIVLRCNKSKVREMLASSASPLRYALGGMAALAVAVGIGRFVYTPILPGMMEQLGLSALEAGLVASCRITSAISPAPSPQQEPGRKAASGCSLCAGSRPARRFAPLWRQRTAFRCSSPSGSWAAWQAPSSWCSCRAIVFSSLSASGRGDLQAVHFGGIGVGIAASSAMMAVLISTDAGWRAGWIGAAILSVLGFAVAARLIDRGPILTDASAAEPPCRARGRWS